MPQMLESPAKTRRIGMSDLGMGDTSFFKSIRYRYDTNDF